MYTQFCQEILFQHRRIWKIVTFCQNTLNYKYFLKVWIHSHLCEYVSKTYNNLKVWPKGQWNHLQNYSLLIGSSISHAYANKDRDHLLKVHPAENADYLTAVSEICMDLGWNFFNICFFFCVWATLWGSFVNHYCSQILNSHHHSLCTYSLPTWLWQHLHGAQSKSFAVTSMWIENTFSIAAFTHRPADDFCQVI